MPCHSCRRQELATAPEQEVPPPEPYDRQPYSASTWDINLTLLNGVDPSIKNNTNGRSRIVLFARGHSFIGENVRCMIMSRQGGMVGHRRGQRYRIVFKGHKQQTNQRKRILFWINPSSRHLPRVDIYARFQSLRVVSRAGLSLLQWMEKSARPRQFNHISPFRDGNTHTMRLRTINGNVYSIQSYG